MIVATLFECLPASEQSLGSFIHLHVGFRRSNLWLNETSKGGGFREILKVRMKKRSDTFLLQSKRNERDRYPRG